MVQALMPASAQHALSATAVSAGRPLHAVVVLVDDLGYGDTGFMGAEYKTHHIDELALGGIRLNQSYVQMLCSPSRASLLSSRYPYNLGMDGDVLKMGDERCLHVTTVGHQMHRSGVRTAFIGKYDVGYSSWACTPNCKGFEYFLGYYGPAQDYFSHGVAPLQLDFHENREHAPQYRGEYSTSLFFRKGVEWIRKTTSDVSNVGKGTFLYVATQAVHSPIDKAPGDWPGCHHITNEQRRTYCTIVMALDEGIGNLTTAYKTLGLFDDTVLTLTLTFTLTLTLTVTAHRSPLTTHLSPLPLTLALALTLPLTPTSCSSSSRTMVGTMPWAASTSRSEVKRARCGRAACARRPSCIGRAFRRRSRAAYGAAWRTLRTGASPWLPRSDTRRLSNQASLRSTASTSGLRWSTVAPALGQRCS